MKIKNKMQKIKMNTYCPDLIIAYATVRTLKGLILYTIDFAILICNDFINLMFFTSYFVFNLFDGIALQFTHSILLLLRAIDNYKIWKPP